MPENILQIKKLSTRIRSKSNDFVVVDNVSLSIKSGETVALLGESGCGKSMTALSVMRLVPELVGGIDEGEIFINGRDVLALPEKNMRQVRGRQVAMIFQEPMTSLNPVLTIGDQIAESLRFHLNLSGSKCVERVVELLKSVGLPDPGNRINEYPHQLSGGMKQRVMIAIALACEPDLLIADEPTTALDVTIQAQVLSLLKTIQQENNMSILLITHDLGVVSKVADRVAVMYAGEIVEEASSADFFNQPKHPYSKKLFSSLPSWEKRGENLEVISGVVPKLNKKFPGCRFIDRCDSVLKQCFNHRVDWHFFDKTSCVKCHLYSLPKVELVCSKESKENKITAESSLSKEGALLEVNNLTVFFPVQAGLLKKTVGYVRAVDDVSFVLQPGKTLAVVGESGCGKTTIAKSLVQLLELTSGSITYADNKLDCLTSIQMSDYRAAVQMIFQDPFSSMNPRKRIGEIIEEGMVALKVENDEKKRFDHILSLLSQVGLDGDVLNRYPHEFSGGQRQRISIARALAVKPRVLICDEPTSALDVSVQAQVLNLLKSLQRELALSFLFITHNISVVSYLADEILVMYLGRVVESGSIAEVLDFPRHPYTKALLSAALDVSDGDKDLNFLEDDVPSPINPPGGCYFHPRCKQAKAECFSSYPGLTRLNESHSVNCFNI
ncbi:MAG: ABC transporter ATP-binding protein [Methylococcales bacterium]|nr:ABC transporter ATP-binding protein [Methylococcales bacterium]MBT7409289.1 ABC transporter ATP-binding protein [Methylococcales bacterium]